MQNAFAHAVFLDFDPNEAPLKVALSSDKGYKTITSIGNLHAPT